MAGNPLSEETQCRCAGQGNTLYAVRAARDVRLEFPAAPASGWRMYRDTHKLRIGASAHPPDVTVPLFLDTNAIAEAGDFYDYLRGLCGGVPGP